MKMPIMIATALAAASCFSAIEETKPEWLHLKAGSEILSAYQLYGAVFNDEPCFVYTSAIDFDILDSFTAGGGTWTLSDLTKRCKDAHYWWNNETDYDIHLSKDLEFSEGWSINAYVCYLWMVMYHSRDNLPTQRSGLWGFDFDTPYITPFVSFEYQHAYDESLYSETGVKRLFQLSDSISITPSASISAMGSRFKRSFFPENERGYSSGIEAGFIRLRGEWLAYEWLNLYAQFCFLTILDRDIRDTIRDCRDTTYKTEYATFEIGVELKW